ncbi:3-deoxy-D-manno-octulosonic acid kinase [Paraglaciecola sp. MB-3u-78]|jgi:3-deoxy-D-manno-octulosonic acid kinase|uniref:3-deoxy-D-manno-octulosonic acid kinase n=1 Tax=Paraglaciecola sp. MB-3u-78 TaxID=2058332 RepID=UPI000C320B70|nr:3-deoxy-D-manno-octulosonic acid kinase [Paraglaciecola sp. MB-3u-78]PKG97828.1 3-deoxy-D-manno-octulosonic acid kinase [Paraglaciecola sp. MB-3u-78]
MAIIKQKTINSHAMLFDAEHFAAPIPKMFSGQYWQTQDAITGQAIGRGTTYFFQHDKNEYVLRHYRRGGLIGKVLSDQYLFTGLEQSRAWREFKLLQHMQKLGLSSPKPSAAMVTKHGFYYQADIISTKIPSAQDLHHILLNSDLTTNEWQKVGQTIAEFHNHQIYHHDLNIHNIMLDAEHRVWLIDFDKCGIKPENSWKKSNMARLKRSFEKEQRLRNIHWKYANWEILMSAYTKAAKPN